LTFELVEEPPREQSPVAEPDFARWRSCEGEVNATLHRLPGGYLVRFIDRADFTIALEEGVVLCRPVTGTPASAARDLYLNQILPMIRAHQGELIIHASAVAIEGVVASFVGPTGRGKSTLAAAFARAGNPFLSDDGLCLTAVDGRYLASPNRPSFRLWQDSRAAVVDRSDVPAEPEEAKSRVEAGAQLPFQAEALPLGAIYFLGEGNSAAPIIVALSARQALTELINQSFFLDSEDRARTGRHFEALSRLAETVPSFALDYPRDYRDLPTVIAAVSDHCLKRGI
jgi:hypothetical protein